MSAHAFLGAEPHPFERRAKGSNVGGRLVHTDAQTVMINARFQPKSDGMDRYQVFSQEHRLKLSGAKAIYTDEPLLTVSPDGLQKADLTTYKGRRYMVVECDDLSDSILPHCRSVALEIEEDSE